MRLDSLRDIGKKADILGQQPVKNGIVAKYTPSRWRGHAYGLSFAIDFGVGALGAALVGRLLRPGQEPLPEDRDPEICERSAANNPRRSQRAA